MNVLLIYPPYSYPKKAPPLGLAYIASVLEHDNHIVKIIDMSVIGINHEILLKEIRNFKPDIIGISFMTNQYYDAVSIAKLAKSVNQEIKVIVGGPHASALPSKVLREESIDIVVVGEGEITMKETVNKLGRGEGLEDVKGVAYKRGSEIMLNKTRKLIEDLDSIPFPAWHLLPLDSYAIPSTGGLANKPVFAILSSRGCPNRCIFCDSHIIFGRRFRWRSADNIIEEIQYLSDYFGAEQFDFVDDTLTANKTRVIDLCEKILANNNLNITWMCNARVNTVTTEMLCKMKQAGCARIEFGVESCDQSVLDTMKKGITIQQIKTAHKIAKEAGLNIGTFVMVGNLGEDFASIKRTQDCLKGLDTDDIYISVATPFPGTELFSIAVENGLLKTEDWSKYVTAPTYLKDYSPIMETDKMNSEQIIDSFLYLHSKFMYKKFRTRYGKAFFIKPRFFKDILLGTHNRKDIFYRIKLAKRLIGRYFGIADRNASQFNK